MEGGLFTLLPLSQPVEKKRDFPLRQLKIKPHLFFGPPQEKVKPC